MNGCSAPVPFETLVELWAGELDPAQAETIEEHLFGCDECAARSDRLAGVVAELRDAIPPIISHAHEARLLERGMRIRRTTATSEEAATARFEPDVDLIVIALRGDLSTADRVDVDLVMDGGAASTFESVPFDRGTGEVLVACQRHYEPMGNEAVFRVHAIEGDARRQVGEFRVHHVWR
jgi:hypothetical protein